VIAIVGDMILFKAEGFHNYLTLRSLLFDKDSIKKNTYELFEKRSRKNLW